MQKQVREFMRIENVNVDEIQFVVGMDRLQRPRFGITYGSNGATLAVVTPALITLYPKVNGDGNLGSMFGPTEAIKTKYLLDLTDTPITGTENKHFETLAAFMNKVDDKLLDFVYQNQLKVMGRKNLSREEVKMLQIRTVRAKYDKNSGALVAHSVNLSCPKYAWDGVGGRFERRINVCDSSGAVVPDGVVSPGDAVAATILADMVYTGVGGDKFGIHWSFRDVQVVAQRSALEVKTHVAEFAGYEYDFATPYHAPTVEMADYPPMDPNAQFA